MRGTQVTMRDLRCVRGLYKLSVWWLLDVTGCVGFPMDSLDEVMVDWIDTNILSTGFSRTFICSWVCSEEHSFFQFCNSFEGSRVVVLAFLMREVLVQVFGRGESSRALSKWQSLTNVCHILTYNLGLIVFGDYFWSNTGFLDTALGLKLFLVLY